MDKEEESHYFFPPHPRQMCIQVQNSLQAAPKLVSDKHKEDKKTERILQVKLSFDL